MSMTLDQISAIIDRIETRMKDVSASLRALPRGPMGLIPDDIRASEQYKVPKREYEILFQQLRNLNSQLSPQQKRSLSAKRRAVA